MWPAPAGSACSRCGETSWRPRERAGEGQVGSDAAVVRPRSSGFASSSAVLEPRRGGGVRTTVWAWMSSVSAVVQQQDVAEASLDGGFLATTAAHPSSSASCCRLRHGRPGRHLRPDEVEVLADWSLNSGASVTMDAEAGLTRSTCAAHPRRVPTQDLRRSRCRLRSIIDEPADITLPGRSDQEHGRSLPQRSRLGPRRTAAPGRTNSAQELTSSGSLSPIRPSAPPM